MSFYTTAATSYKPIPGVPTPSPSPNRIIPGVPDPNRLVPGVPTPHHNIPGVPTPHSNHAHHNNPLLHYRNCLNTNVYSQQEPTRSSNLGLCQNQLLAETGMIHDSQKAKNCTIQTTNQYLHKTAHSNTPVNENEWHNLLSQCKR